MTTINDLLHAGFDIDAPLYVKQNDDPDDDAAIAVDLDYELTVTVRDCNGEHVQAVLLGASDRLGTIIHD